MKKSIPIIDKLDPSTVEKGFEGKLIVHGSEFGDGTYIIVKVGSDNLDSTYKSETEVWGELTSAHTGKTGKLNVRVYKPGGLSEPKTLTVVER
ncbi:IPT/TIG domain-containing protein [Ruegeria lacuscaerulensis]|uniref:IPT/TIG domain-containing protein n=1 Tax=Ruegeria lacuscaerulensis TaxID=55218 RepID=UPI00147B44F7|nr:IPT/TIG domain-containing protein [Ruegeria lacuscaerulensis]